MMIGKDISVHAGGYDDDHSDIYTVTAEGYDMDHARDAVLWLQSVERWKLRRLLLTSILIILGIIPLTQFIVVTGVIYLPQFTQIHEDELPDAELHNWDGHWLRTFIIYAYVAGMIIMLAIVCWSPFRFTPLCKPAIVSDAHHNPTVKYTLERTKSLSHQRLPTTSSMSNAASINSRMSSHKKKDKAMLMRNPYDLEREMIDDLKSIYRHYCLLFMLFMGIISAWMLRPYDSGLASWGRSPTQLSSLFVTNQMWQLLKPYLIFAALDVVFVTVTLITSGAQVQQSSRDLNW